jgi:type I restriction enzyme S subunit
MKASFLKERVEMIGGWKNKAIGQLFDIQLGKMLNEKAKTGPQFPYLANYNVRWGYFDLSQLNEMTFSDREKDKYTLQKGDLLMCEGGEIGRCAIWQSSDAEIYYQKALHRLRPKGKEALTEYLYFYMQFFASQGNLSRIVGETSIAHLTREKLLGLPMTYPSLSEQKAIAEMLSAWDVAIEKTERLVNAKEKRLDAYARMLFDYKNNGEYEGLKAVKLRTVLTEHGEKSTGSEAVFSVSVHKGLVNQIEHLGRSFSAVNINNYNRVHYGDIVYTKSPTGDFPLGIVKQSYVEEDVIVSPLYGVFTPKTFNLGIVLDFYFGSPNRAINYLSPIVQKGAKNTIAITNNTFLSKDLHLPVDERVQKYIAEFVLAAREEILLLKKLADKYKTQKRGLMQKMLTGEWRLKPEVVKKYTEV